MMYILTFSLAICIALFQTMIIVCYTSACTLKRNGLSCLLLLQRVASFAICLIGIMIAIMLLVCFIERKTGANNAKGLSQRLKIDPIVFAEPF